MLAGAALFINPKIEKMRIQLSLQHRQFPEQPKDRNHHIIQLIPENAKEIVISNFDNKDCCRLTAHIFGESGKDCQAQSNIRKDIRIRLSDKARYRLAIELLPDGIKDEVIDLDVDFE